MTPSGTLCGVPRTYKQHREQPTGQSLSQRALTFLVLATVVVIPLSFDLRGQDTWRLPKEIVFRGSAIVLSIVLVFLLTSRYWPPSVRTLGKHELLLTLAAVTWAAITTATSTNRLLSLHSLTTVVCSAIFFIAALISMRSASIIALDFALVPAGINAVIVILQEYGIWQPFHFPPEAVGHMSSSALIGNPNDVGAYLAFPALVSAIASVDATGARRTIYFAVALLLTGGLIASATRGSIIAYVIALGYFIATRSVRAAVGVAIPLIVAVAILVSPTTEVGRRMHAMVTAAREHRYDIVFSERLPPFLAAWQMFRDHPIVGVGPGCFKFQFMDYRLSQLARYPERLIRGTPMNWGETHNDHLQILAESGFPGYLLFLAAAILIVLQSLRADSAASIRERIGHDIAAPLVITMFIVAMAQFPLQIAAPRVTLLYFAAMCIGWSHGAP